MKLNNKIYDVLKWTCIIVLPAIATLYGAISTIWHIPYSEQVVGTIAAIETCLGTIICIGNYEYEKDQK